LSTLYLKKNALFLIAEFWDDIFVL
jgi:hypothetical protein